MVIRRGDTVARSRMRTPTAMPAAMRGPGAGSLPSVQHLVLVVDDDVDARVLRGALLHEAGCRAVGAATGVEAFAVLRWVLGPVAR